MTFKEVLDKAINWIYINRFEIVLSELVIFLAVVLFVLAYKTYTHLNKYSIIRTRINEAYERLQSAANEREKEAQEKRLLVGRTDDKNMLDRFDELIAYSGIRNYAKWLTTEIALSIMIGVVVTVAIIVIVLMNNFILAIASGALAYLLMYSILLFMKSKQRDAIDKQIIQFVNIVRNFANTSDDLIEILEKTYPYMDRPLREYLRRCVTEARSSGDGLAALAKLEENVDHDYFRLVIRNLSISSRYEANYAEIVEDSKEMLKQYLAHEQKKAQIYKGGRIEILAIFLLGLASVGLVGKISPSNKNVIQLMMEGGTIGNGVLLFVIGVAGFVIYTILIKTMRH